MKTKSAKPSTPRPRKTPDLVECLDAIDAHLRAVRTMAGLMELCLEIPAFGHVDAEMVGDTGFLISQELRETEGALADLREALKGSR